MFSDRCYCNFSWNVFFRCMDLFLASYFQLNCRPRGRRNLLCMLLRILYSSVLRTRAIVNSWIALPIEFFLKRLKSLVRKIEIFFYLQFRASFSVDKLPLALFDKLQRAHRSVAIAVYLDRLFQVSLARRFAFVPGNVLSISHDVARSVLCWIACRCCWRLRVAWSLRSRAAVLNQSLRTKWDLILTF